MLSHIYNVAPSHRQQYLAVHATLFIFASVAFGDMQALLADSTVNHLWDKSGSHTRQLEERAALTQLLRASSAGEPAAVARLDALTKVIFAAMPGSLAATPGFWVPHTSILYKLDDASLAALMLLIQLPICGSVSQQ
jgi:hypothetical protein